MNKIKKNVCLLFIIFFVVPIIITFLSVYYLSESLDLDIIKKVLSVSGYLFSLSSLILVFILFKNFSVSDFKKSDSEKKYLEDEAIKELVSSLEIIRACIKRNKVKGLEKSCRSVRHIYRSLSGYEDDVGLKPYSNQIKRIFNLINKHKLVSIGYDGDSKKLGKMKGNIKMKIIDNIDDLEKNLNRMIQYRGENN